MAADIAFIHRLCLCTIQDFSSYGGDFTVGKRELTGCCWFGVEISARVNKVYFIFVPGVSIVPPRINKLKVMTVQVETEIVGRKGLC